MKIWLLDWKSCFGQRVKCEAPLGLNFGLGRWRLHIMPSRRLQSYILLAIFNPLFGLSTKFGRSIPRLLDLDSHSVKAALI